MRSIALYEMLLGLLAIIGGIVGYTSTGSIESLISGVLAGVVLIGAGLGMQKGSRSAMYVALVVTLLLAVYGAHRLVQDSAFMPGGLVLVFTGISLLLIVALMVQPRERRRLF